MRACHSNYHLGVSRACDYTGPGSGRLKRRWNALNWIGFAIVLAAFLSYTPLFAVFPATRDFPWANYLLFVIGAALLGAGVRRAFRDPDRYRGKISGSILAVLSVLIIASFVAGVTYFSRQIPNGDTAMAAGRKAPPFVLTDVAGKQVSSADLLKDHRGLVLIFYRGYW